MTKETTLDRRTEEFIDDMMQGNARALAKLITIVEQDDEDSYRVLRHVKSTGRAHRVGVTGPPGAGKSTLVNRLTSYAREHELRVGVICADPSSPFSGGAVLGDRVRMSQHYMDEGVHIRSMSLRGSLGGLPATVHGVIKLMDASGKDLILVETVGVGQMELDVMDSVDTVVVTLVPEAGDDVQAMKAGLMEIADIFVVNKSDRPGADSLTSGIRSMLDLVYENGPWKIPVLSTQAENNIGVDALYKQIWRHREVCIDSGVYESRRAKQRQNEFTTALEKMVVHEFTRAIESDKRLSEYVELMNRGELSPYAAAEEIFGIISRKAMKRPVGDTGSSD
ncbi:MAG: methylmalonyl Co-A mutase-associated GTPase MeaB [Dehalococcoidia bacterium]|nr:methylmalonyl Co-A mutase-associated GTPase MeaB [Dehalococcoidia bacterium]